MLLPQLIAEQLTTAGVVLKPLVSSTLRRRPSVIWRKDTTLSFAAMALMQLIRERYAGKEPQ
jgi:DNA-binding transcriptional LysR family regulator